MRTAAARALRGGALLLLALPSAAAARPVPDRLCPDSYQATLSRPSIIKAEIKVTCVVERDTALANRVIAEARQALNRAAGAAEAAVRGVAIDDREERRFTLAVEPTHVTSRVASLLTTIMEAHGSVRPIFTPRTLTWDFDRGLYVTLNQLLREPKPGGPAMLALRDAVRSALKAEIGGDQNLLVAIKAEPSSFLAWTLEPGTDPDRAGGITVHYGTNSVVGRSLKAFVPAEVLIPHLAPAWRDLFGPSRPR